MKNIIGSFGFIFLVALILSIGQSFAQTETQSTHDNFGGGTGTQVGAATVPAGATNVPLYGLGFNVTSGSPSFSAVTFTTSGTYTASDILNFKLWECNFDVFPSSSAVQRGSAITIGLGPGSHTFSALGITIATGSFHCFYITADIASGATAGHTIICNVITKPNTIISGTNNFGTNLQGGTQTIATSLPVELISFCGKNAGTENHLEWATASELNNNFFTVERSTDGIHFQFVDNVYGAGSSNCLHSYNYADRSLDGSGSFYYRLKQTDYDGSSKFLNTIFVSALKTELVNLHFDPMSRTLSLETYFEEAGVYKFAVINVSGRLIWNRQEIVAEGKNNFQLPLTLFSDGVYFLKVYGKNSSLQSSFVIN